MGGGLIIEANIPVQELEGQRGEGAYFREDTVYTTNFSDGHFSYVPTSLEGSRLVRVVVLCAQTRVPGPRGIES